MDLESLPIVFDKSKIEGRFRLVSIAIERAKDLSIGAKPIGGPTDKKLTTLALEETVSGVLEYLTGEEARAAKEEARKFDYRRLLEERKRDSVPEELSELEKDLKLYLNEKEDKGKGALDDLFGESQKEGAEKEPEK